MIGSQVICLVNYLDVDLSVLEMRANHVQSLLSGFFGNCTTGNFDIGHPASRSTMQFDTSTVKMDASRVLYTCG